MSARKRPQPRPGVLAIDPYVPGKSKAPGVARVFKLSSNETPLGPSPNAIAAYKAVAEQVARLIQNRFHARIGCKSPVGRGHAQSDGADQRNDQRDVREPHFKGL